MCVHIESNIHNSCSATAATATATTKAVKAVQNGSLRKKIWDLPAKLLCPIVGVCIPLNSLRAMVNKLFTEGDKADDYSIHVGVIYECRSRTVMAQELHKNLEKRHSSQIKKFNVAKTKLNLAQMWEQALLECEDIAGALWAVCTHSKCDDELIEAVYKDIHMIQHQVSDANRANIKQLNTLAQENEVLVREMARIQDRITRQMHEKNQEIEALKNKLTMEQAATVGKDWQIGCLQSKLDHVTSSVQDFPARLKLQEKNEFLELRVQTQKAEISDLLDKLNALNKKNFSQECKQDTGKLVGELNTDQKDPLITVKAQLQEKSILCVGGRTGSVSNYRHVIESAGAKFAYHDGGLENNNHLLETSLTAADYVICQTGCISHNAYWRVKDHCKRLGKQCVFIENPSVSTLTRGLEQFVTLEN